MSNSDALRRDLSVTDIILSVYSRYVDVLFVAHTVLFVTVMYVMKSLNAKSKLSEYRLCLLANNVSVYLFELFMFLGKPSFIPSGIYVPSNGIICLIHPIAGYLNLYAIVFALFAQLTSMKLSIAFQYGAASSSMASSKLHERSTAIVKYIFRSTKSFWLSFCTSCALEIGTAWTVLVVTGRANALEFLGKDSADSSALITFLQRFRSVTLIEIRGTSVLGPLAAAFVFLLVGSYVVLSYVALRTYRVARCSKTSTSAKTAFMQATLFRCILVQAICLTAFYLLPLSVLFLMVLLPSVPFSASVGAGCFTIMVTYPPLNYIILLVLVPQFREELAGTLKRVLRRMPPKSSDAVTVVGPMSEVSASRK